MLTDRSADVANHLKRNRSFAISGKENNNEYENVQASALNKSQVNYILTIQ